MVEVDIEFIKDQFNLHGLKNFTKEKFMQCMKIICAENRPTEDDLSDETFVELN